MHHPLLLLLRNAVFFLEVRSKAGKAIVRGQNACSAARC